MHMDYKFCEKTQIISQESVTSAVCTHTPLFMCANLSKTKRVAYEEGREISR